MQQDPEDPGEGLGVLLYPQTMAVSPQTMRRVHACLTAFWICVWIAAAFLGWLKSVTFVAHLSIAALVLTSWGAWQGARAEEKADSAVP